MIAAIAWDNYQGRTQALASTLGGTAWYLRSRPTQRQLVLIRYLVDGIKMWRLLEAHRPRVLLTISPPLLPPLIGWLWCSTHECLLIIDCHTGTLHSRRWRWLTWLLKPACRSAVATLVHTTGDEELILGWKAQAILVPDELPDPGLAELVPPKTHPCVVVAGSLDGNEPVAATVAAARLVPEIELRLTGRPDLVAAAVRRDAPPNVVFTGWLRYPKFLGELCAADAVAVLSTDPHIMNRAAFETIGLGRPLLLSDLPGLRARFGPAAIFTANEPQAIAHALRQALAQREDLARRSVELRSQLAIQHEEALARLRAAIRRRARSDLLEISQPPLAREVEA